MPPLPYGLHKSLDFNYKTSTHRTLARFFKTIVCLPPKSQGQWKALKKFGQHIAKDEIIAKIIDNSIPKGSQRSSNQSFDIKAPCSGIITRLLPVDGQDVAELDANQAIVEVYSKDESQSGLQTDEKKNANEQESNADVSRQPILVGTFPESIVEGDLRIIKPLGTIVKKNEIIAEIETDKTTMPVNSPMDGKLVNFLFQDGDVITSNAHLCDISTRPSETETLHDPTVSTNAGLNPASVKCSTIVEGRKDGQRQVEYQPKIRFASQSSKTKMPDSPNEAQTVNSNLGASASSLMSSRDSNQIDRPESRDSGNPRHINITNVSKIRRVIAERLKYSQNTNATLTTFNEINMEHVLALRQRLNDHMICQASNSSEPQAKKIGILPFFVSAATRSLLRFPLLNSFLDEKCVSVHEPNYVDISVAVSSDRGLFVPVIRDCQELRISEIGDKITQFSQKAASNSLTPHDLHGGTFSITNGGVFGSLLSTPVINPPQSAILGMHSVQKRPVAGKDDRIEVKPMMYVALSYDHRLIDGKQAVQFLVAIKQYIECPESLLI